ncbi:MAG: acetylxylan esterase [Fimbriimonas sp.]
MIRRRLPILLLVAFPLATWAYCAQIQTPPTQVPVATVVPFKASGIYDQGERAGWTIANPPGASLGKVAYTLKRNNHEVIQKGELDLGPGPATVEIREKAPAMLYLELAAPGGKPRAFGAAIAPTKLRPVAPKPKDFDAFWNAKIKALKAVPENAVVTPGESYKPEVEYATVKMDHVNGTHVYGQLAKPKRPGKFPAMLVLQWASPPYPLHNSWVIEPAAQGWLTLNIQPHDVPVSAPRAYYEGLPTAIKNYASIGADDRERSYFVEMYLRDFRAAEYLAHHPQWDGKTLLVMGTSMGGQQSLAVAGLHPKISHLIVNVPAGCDLNAPLYGRQMGYPFLPANDPKVMETSRYVDCINFAPRIRATSLVAMGFVDDISPPAGIWTAFNLIRGKKEAAPMVDSPHNNFATAEQQRPYTARSAAWLNALVRGEKIP